MNICARLKLHAALFALLVGFGLTAAATPLEAWIQSPETWQTTAANYIIRHRAWRLHWVSETDRSVLRSALPQLSLLEHPIEDLHVRFSQNRPDRISAMIYNRGDSGSIEKERFTELLNQLRQDITDFANRSPSRQESQRRGRNINIHRQHWRLDPNLWTLLWSETEARRSGGVNYPYQAEFITLHVQPLEIAAAGRSTRASAQHRRTVPLTNHLQRHRNGDLFIANLPMVDQGDKGYCAVASLERIMRHYQIDIDQHELAQIARTSTRRGTNPEVMLDALRQAGAFLGIYIRSHEEFEARDLQQLIQYYNRLARRQRAEQVELGRTVELTTLYLSLDYDLLKEARGQRQSNVRGFMRTIERYIDRGIPLLWSCMVGIVPESPPLRGAGGHMRLIIGYNSETEEIIYSDSWGHGHEFKRMPLADAYTITLGLHTAELRDHR